MKLRTKIMLLVFCVVAAILLLNQYPVSMNMRQSLLEAEGNAMKDMLHMASTSEEWIDSLRREDRASLMRLAKNMESYKSCSGLAVIGRDWQVYYNSEEHDVELEILREYAIASPSRAEYRFVTQEDQTTVTYAYCPIHDADGEILGAIVSKLINAENQAGVRKAQRDLNAMTLLVMLIALVFV